MARFRKDVLDYGERWEMTLRGMATAAGLSDNTIMPWVRGTRDGIGLSAACGLADVCDLSLDNYRKEYIP